MRRVRRNAGAAARDRASAAWSYPNRSLQSRDGLPRPSRIHGAARVARRTAARARARRSAARDDRALRSRAEGRRPGAAVRAAEGRTSAHRPAARFPCWATCSARRSASRARWAWRATTGARALREIGRLLAFLKEPEPPKGLQDAWQNTRPVFMKVLDMAPKERSSGAVPGRRVGGRRRRPRAPAGADLLAGRRGSAHHVGPHRHARPAQEAAEPRHLPAAGDRAQQGDHALAQHKRRRARFPRSRARASRARRFPVAVALGADPATILGAVTPVPDTLSEYQFAGLLRGERTEIVKCLTHDLQVPASAEIVLEGFLQPDAADPTGYETARRRPVRRSHRLLQRGRALPGAHDRAHHAAPRSDLSLDLHRQAARRARGARRRAERGVRAAARRSSFPRSPTSTCRRKAARTGSPSCR